MLKSPGYEFLEKLRSYREPWFNLLGDGLNPQHPSGNSLLYESHAAWIFKDFSEMSLPHSDFYFTLHKLTAARGLLRRKPAPAEDPQTHDDYIGATSVCSAMGVYVHQRGQETGWWYDSNDAHATFWDGFWNIVWGVKPISSLDNWHGRMPGVVQHYQISAGVAPSPLGWLVWLLSIKWSTRKPGNESGWLLSYLQVRLAAEMFPQHWAVVSAANTLKTQLSRCYGGNISRVYAVYFGAEHPFTHYASWPQRHQSFWSSTDHLPAACEQVVLGTEPLQEHIPSP